jgi:uncharacterized short protein YbdD (DUF466 family)
MNPLAAVETVKNFDPARPDLTLEEAAQERAEARAHGAWRITRCPKGQ